MQLILSIEKCTYGCHNDRMDDNITKPDAGQKQRRGISPLYSFRLYV